MMGKKLQLLSEAFRWKGGRGHSGVEITPPTLSTDGLQYPKVKCLNRS
jgi:hypothetical protein